jgi:hypothetical protein
MRPATVRLVDIGLSTGFDTATTFADSLIDSLTWTQPPEFDVPRTPHPAAEVELVRTRDLGVLAKAVTAEATILHLLSHGRTDQDGSGFASDDRQTELDLADLAKLVATDRIGIRAQVIFADCCDGARRTFVSALRDCLDHVKGR